MFRKCQIFFNIGIYLSSFTRISQFGGGRELFQVKGNSGAKYSLVKATSFCNCPAFQVGLLDV